MTHEVQPQVNDVLLAEDDPVSAAFLTEALRTLGLSCEATPDGVQALALARAAGYRLLLLDVQLPGMSGPELLRVLKSESTAASRTTPALALSAELSPEREAVLRAVGFDAVGSKPLSIARLGTLLRELGIEAGPGLSVPDAAPQVWDDARALRALGGRHEIMAKLRALMLQELPRQRATLATAFAAGDHAGARAELHRLRASCGFCGASTLDTAILAWQDAADRRLACDTPGIAVLAAIDALMASLPQG